MHIPKSAHLRLKEKVKIHHHAHKNTVSMTVKSLSVLHKVNRQSQRTNVSLKVRLMTNRHEKWQVLFSTSKKKTFRK